MKSVTEITILIDIFRIFIYRWRCCQFFCIRNHFKTNQTHQFEFIRGKRDFSKKNHVEIDLKKTCRNSITISKITDWKSKMVTIGAYSIKQFIVWIFRGTKIWASSNAMTVKPNESSEAPKVSSMHRIKWINLSIYWTRVNIGLRPI